LWDLQSIEESLGPIIAASPKNEHGRLGDSAARYALHRLFMERHGWEIKGFSDAPLSPSSPHPSLFEHWVPPEVQAVLEDRVSVRGFGILELSVFAASLEHLIRQETPSKLQGVYGVLGVPITGYIDRAQAEMIIDLSMGAYIRSEDLTMLSPFELFRFQTDMSFVYDNWDKTRQFFRQIQESVVPEAELTFQEVAVVLETIEANFVYWNEHQCAAFKENLMALEQEEPGRVRLLDFYEAGMKGLPTIETVSYLQELGVIDNADPLEPRLILSNYLDSPSNCIARNSYYSVCCMDQCADLYSHLERNLGKPEASAEEILSVVSGLSTGTTCRVLPGELRSNLFTLAEENGGRVVLHGKAFAEWMHFVYPRECTWPQKFGPAYSQTVGEWELATFSESQADMQELMRYTEKFRGLEKEKIAHVAMEQQQQQQQQEQLSRPRSAFMAPIVLDDDDEPPMIGASKKKNSKKKRLTPESELTLADAYSSGGDLQLWWLAPALGALYAAARYRSETLRNREGSCGGASCAAQDSSAVTDFDVYRHV
jgi:hypothetical protein